MCDAGAAATIIVAVVAAGASAAQQADNQRRQVSARDRATDITSANAAVAANAQYIATIERVAQTRQAAAQEAHEAAQEADQAHATLTVGAAHAGLEGGVVSDLRTSIAQQAARDAGIRARSATWEESQIMRSLDRISADHQSRVNSTAGPSIQGVDYGGLIGSLGEAGIGAYSGYQNRQTRREALRVGGTGSTSPQTGRPYRPYRV